MNSPRRDTTMSPLPLSIVIISKNEAERIEACLASVTWADEIVVVDSGSTDGTQDIARRYTDKVFEVPWRGYGLQKRAAVELASHDMIFNIDCDEQMTKELAIEIRTLLESECLYTAYSVPRRTFIANKEIKHCGWNPDRVIRMFDRRRANFSDNQVHERVVVAPEEVACCQGHLLHYSFRGMSDMLSKLNNYTDIAAREMYASGRRTSLAQVTVRPVWTFIRTYFFYCGFLDGYEGLEVALANSITVFYKYSKLRELTVNKLESS